MNVHTKPNQPKQKNRPFTKAEEGVIIELHRKGVAQILIAKKLGRSSGTLSQKMRKMGIKSHDMRNGVNNGNAIASMRERQGQPAQDKKFIEQISGKFVQIRAEHPEPIQPVAFMELGNSQCRFPIDGSSGALMMCCAAPVRDKGQSYCLHCFEASTGPGTRSERDAGKVLTKLGVG